jgi:hypothetical protein
MNAFQAAGRRPEQMSPMDEVSTNVPGHRKSWVLKAVRTGPSWQVLCNAIIAAAARQTDHSLLLGATVPKLVEQKALLKGVDLSPWGRRREVICKGISVFGSLTPWALVTDEAFPKD